MRVSEGLSLALAIRVGTVAQEADLEAALQVPILRVARLESHHGAGI
jgi:hypothetical protein